MGDRPARGEDKTEAARPIAEATTAAAGRRAPDVDHTLTDAGPRPRPSSRAIELPEVAADHYEIGAEIAHGGMGRIRAARDLRLGREVAIKELLEPRGALAVRFEREALVTARLQHPAIVSVYEAGRWPSGEPFFAMKLVHGRPLKKVIASAASFDARLALLPHVLAVADAMAYAHGQQIVHRDLKPANVLVGDFGETVVIDWGLAKDLAAPSLEGDVTPASRSSDPSLTRAGSVIGTPNYMPPEQARGEPVDERADVYAIGAMLYHLLSGVPPFVGEDSDAVLAMVAGQPPKPLAEHAPTIAPDLLAIVERAMARDPHDRYPTARELAEDLRRFQTGQLVASHRYTRGELVRRFAHRHRLALGVGIAAAAVLAIVGAISVQRIRAQRDQARTERARADGERATAERERATALARADQLMIERAGQLVERDPAGALATLAGLSPGSPLLPAARVIASDARARRIERVSRVDGGVQLTNLVAAADGAQLVTGAEDGSIRLWDAATLSSQIIGRHERMSYVYAIVGGKLITSSYDQTVRVWNLTGGGEPVVLAHPGPVRQLAVSMDATVIVSVCDDRLIRIWDVASRQPRRVLGDGHGDGFIRLSPDGRILAYQIGDRPPRVLELASGTEHALEPSVRLPPIATRCEAGFCTDVQTIDLSPDGATLAIAAADGTVSLWDWRLGSRRILGRVDKDPIARIRFSADGAALATWGSVAHEVRLWSTTGGPPRTLGTVEWDGTMAISPDGHLLAVSGDPAVVWDLDTGQETELLGPIGQATSLAFVAGGTRIVGVAGSAVWSWPARGDERVIARVTPPARQVDALPGGRMLIAGGDGQIRIGDEPPRTTAGALVGRIAVASDGTRAAMIGVDDAVRVVDLTTHAVQRLDGTFPVGQRSGPADLNEWTMSEPSGTFYSAIVRRLSRRERERRGWVDHVVFSPDGRTLALAHARGGEVQLWGLATGARQIVETGKADVERFAFTPDGTTLLAGGSDGRVHVVDIARGAARALDGHTAPVEDLAVMRDGRTVASASTDHTVRLWDLATGTSRVVCVLGAPVGQVMFGPDETRLVSTGDDGAICVADLRAGSSRLFEGHRAPVLALAIAPDGTTLASSDLNGEVRLWDLATGQGRTFDVPNARVGDLAFTADGTRVVGAASDGTVWSWSDDLPRGETELRAWIVRALGN